MEVSQNIKKEYLMQDLDNPQYIFHGSNSLLPTIKPHQANDTNKKGPGNQFAIYGTPLPLVAALFALKSKKFSSTTNITPDISKLKTTIYNGSIPEDSTGYIHVCKSANFHRCGEGYQWVCYEEVTPVDIIQVYCKDFKDFFEFVELPKEELDKKMGR